MILKESYSTYAGKAALGVNGTWQSSWLDNGVSLAELFASVSVYSDQPGQIQIIQTDDPTNPSMVLPVQGGVASVGAGSVSELQVPITHLYWSVLYINGTTAQTIFEIVVSASSSDLLAVLVELQRVNFNLVRLINPYTATDDTYSLNSGSF